MAKEKVYPTADQVLAVLAGNDGMGATDIAVVVAQNVGVRPTDLVTSKDVGSAVSLHALRKVLDGLVESGRAEVRMVRRSRGAATATPVWETAEDAEVRRTTERLEQGIMVRKLAEQAAMQELPNLYPEEFAGLVRKHMGEIIREGR